MSKVSFIYAVERRDRPAGKPVTTLLRKMSGEVPPSELRPDEVGVVVEVDTPSIDWEQCLISLKTTSTIVWPLGGDCDDLDSKRPRRVSA